MVGPECIRGAWKFRIRACTSGGLFWPRWPSWLRTCGTRSCAERCETCWQDSPVKKSASWISRSACRHLSEERLRAPGDLLGAHIFLVGRDRPFMAEGIDEPAGAVAVEHVHHRNARGGARGDSSGVNRVHIFHMQGNRPSDSA